jgi:hypothetical protein
MIILIIAAVALVACVVCAWVANDFWSSDWWVYGAIFFAAVMAITAALGLQEWLR